MYEKDCRFGWILRLNRKRRIATINVSAATARRGYAGGGSGKDACMMATLPTAFSCRNVVFSPRLVFLIAFLSLVTAPYQAFYHECEHERLFHSDGAERAPLAVDQIEDDGFYETGSPEHDRHTCLECHCYSQMAAGLALAAIPFAASTFIETVPYLFNGVESAATSPYWRSHAPPTHRNGA